MTLPSLPVYTRTDDFGQQSTTNAQANYRIDVPAGVKTLVVLTEHIPLHDVMTVHTAARWNGTRVLGPNTAGMRATHLGLFCERTGLPDNLKLRRILIDNVTETFRWLESMGVVFHGPLLQPPHRKPRMHNVLPNSRATRSPTGIFATFSAASFVAFLPISNFTIAAVGVSADTINAPAMSARNACNRSTMMPPTTVSTPARSIQSGSTSIESG